ncbi:M23/M56 family metallopeptidase [Asticcacaulis sp. AC466]|uniref:M23/M56 family metallopeptidase n=1 Tax=Asticcacaulis sp. AC466 TaxID=1282362 RepID=UPI000426FC9B|nr:M23/M56 family metallopeptidase [Asticcacaulis sp. AC466]
MVLGLMPLLASALILAIHRLFRERDDAPVDGVEKRMLAVMIVPVAMGAVLLLLARLAPALMTAPIPEYSAGNDAVAMTGEAVTSVSQARFSWVTWALAGIPLLPVVYAVVAAVAAIRLLRAQSVLRTIARMALPLPADTGIRIASGAVPAFAWGRHIIVPQRLLTGLGADQLELVIAHERAHLRRGDTGFYTLLSWIEVIFWFNPFIRHQTARCRLAAELACDALVTRANPEMRQAYAASLLTALKHTAGATLPISTQTCAPTVFSPSNSGEFRMRITEIMRASSMGRKRPRWIAQAMAVALILPLAGAQFVLSQNPARAASDAAFFSVLPVTGTISSPFGKRTDPLTGAPAFHEGIDVRGKIGTPIYAPAAGRVVTVKTDSRNGLMLEINHGDGYVTRYTHLNKITVDDTASVTAGQQIAELGNSGQNTGPHLHFMVFKNGAPIDPATVLPQMQATPSSKAM